MDKKYILRSGIRTAKWSRLAAKVVDLLIILILSTTLYPMGPILGIVYISLSEVQPNENTTVESKIPGMYMKSMELDRAEAYCRKALNYNKKNNRIR